VFVFVVFQSNGNSSTSHLWFQYEILCIFSDV
jgi:hypothetical protein